MFKAWVMDRGCSVRIGEWHWYFSDRKAFDEMGSLAGLPEGARLIHSVVESCFERSVYYRDGLYFKQEKLTSPGFWKKFRNLSCSRAEREFKSLRMLRTCGVNAVEPVAFGLCGVQSILVTKEEKNTVPVRTYLLDLINSGKAIPDDFLFAWGGVMTAFVYSNIYFPDFHCGNLLYDETARRFTVVDALGARRVLINRNSHFLRMIKRQYGMLFEFFEKSAVLKMLAVLDAKHPERLYRRVLEFSTDHVRCAKRKRKRLNHFRADGYTRTINGIQRKISNDEQLFSLEGTEVLKFSEAEAVELWERDYMLSQFRLPLLRIVARKPGCGILYRQLAMDGKVSDARKAELLERLEMAGFPDNEFDFCLTRSGRAVLRDCKYSTRNF